MKKRKMEKIHRKEYVKELKKVCSEQLKQIEGTFKVISEINFIGAIKSRIETLAAEEALQKEGDK
jgi:hypothetical protein